MSTFCPMIGHTKVPILRHCLSCDHAAAQQLCATPTQARPRHDTGYPESKSIASSRAARCGGRAGCRHGSGAITGFPTIWAQNIKDVVLHHAGPPVTAIPAIAEQATKDLGFTVHMQASENADLLNRFLSQSSAIDCADISIVFMRYLIGREHAAGHPARQGQGLGQDDPAVHQGRISRRPEGLAAGHHAVR